MQQVVMRVLAVMMVASFLLAVVSFVWPAPVSAEYWPECPVQGCCDCGCEEGHMACSYFYEYIHQGTGGHCTYMNMCEKHCYYDTWNCPD